MIKKEWIPYLFMIGLLCLGSFYDYTITDHLFGHFPSVSIFFERMILMPIQSVIVWTFCLLYVEKKQVWKLVCAFIASMYVVIDVLHYWFIMDNLWILISVMLSLLLMGSMLLILYRIPKTWISKYRHFFLFFTCVLLSSMLITTIIKGIWGRVRYRDLQSIGEFCVWYKPCGKISNYSFPSGHTAAISVIVCLLQWKGNPYQKVSFIRYIVIGGVICLMALSRMMMGAHFLTDTAVGFGITYSMYLAWKYYFRKRGVL